MNDYDRQIRELRAINAQMTRHRDELAVEIERLRGEKLEFWRALEAAGMPADGTLSTLIEYHRSEAWEEGYEHATEYLRSGGTFR
jgi:hypothetical protein